MPGGVLPQRKPSQVKALRQAIQQPDVPTWMDLAGGTLAFAPLVGAAALPLAGGETTAVGTGATAESGAAGGAAGGATSKVASTVANNAGKALTALSIGALFSNIGLWKGVGMVIAGGILILIGILNLAGVDAGGVARRVIP